MNPVATIALFDALALSAWIALAREGIALALQPKVETGMDPFDVKTALPHFRSGVFELQKRGFEPIGQKWERIAFATRTSKGADLASPDEKCFASVYGHVKKTTSEGPAIYLFTAYEGGALVLTWNTPRPLYETATFVESGVDTFDVSELVAAHRRRTAPFAARKTLPLTAEGRVAATHAFYANDYVQSQMRLLGRHKLKEKLWLLLVLLLTGTVLGFLLATR